MNLKELKALALEHGVTVVDHGNGHIQLKGQLSVSYYPFSKKRTAYVEGTTAGRINIAPLEAVLMAVKKPEPVAQDQRAKRNAGYARHKKRLLAADPRCHWCSTALKPETATLDHKIPLFRGGLNHPVNYVLACLPCNARRGSDMPELEAAETVGDWYDRRSSLSQDVLRLSSEFEDSRNKVRAAANPAQRRRLLQEQSVILANLRTAKDAYKSLNIRIAALEGQLYQTTFAHVTKELLHEELYLNLRKEVLRRLDELGLPGLRLSEDGKVDPEMLSASEEDIKLSWHRRLLQLIARRKYGR